MAGQLGTGFNGLDARGPPGPGLRLAGLAGSFHLHSNSIRSRRAAVVAQRSRTIMM